MTYPTPMAIFRRFLGGSALALMAAALLFGGCASGRPPLSEELTAEQTLPVKRKLFILFSGEQIRFGEYAVQKVKRDSAMRIMRPKFSRIAIELHETYTFRMDKGSSAAKMDPQIPWTGNCRSEGRRADEIPFFGPLREQEYRVVLQCDYLGPDSVKPWKLHLVEEDSAGRALKGILTDGSTSIKVQGSRQLGSNTREESHTSFEFSGEGRVLGAVLLAKGDRVIFRSDTPDPVKRALAAAAASLILYLDNNERMKMTVEARLQSEKGIYL